ncbi:ABC transporter permease [Nocardioides sp. L-11A]|uniref:ABC transporter permease n=1 Tax=Nocardioides sp. L-11A TaxID=3043848 RepID=UPI00249C2DDC|nr:ABC transporter permease [Nocardioides sp. L-11A]
MLRLVGQRLAQTAPILFALSLAVFAWVRALPGGPANALLGEHASPEAIAEVNAAYALDEPIWTQYWRFVVKLVQLDLGSSIRTRQPVMDEIASRFPATVELTVAGLLIAVVVGVPLGTLAAKYHGRWPDRLSVVGSLLGISIPVFFLALLLKYVFAVELGWLPASGRLEPTSQAAHPTGFYVLDGILTRDGAAVVDALRHLLLPALALASVPLAIISRVTRASLLQVQTESYIRTATAKGLGPLRFNVHHLLRNGLLPVITIVGLQGGILLSGAVLTETVFSWGGMGSWMLTSIQYRDFPAMQAGILFLALIFVLVNMLVDLTYLVIDPRLKRAE